MHSALVLMWETQIPVWLATLLFFTISNIGGNNPLTPSQINVIKQ